MKKYSDFRITATPFLSDVITGALWELDITGIGEYENYIDVYAEEKAKVTKAEIEKILSRLKEENLIENFSVEEFSLEDKNWNAEWEKNVDIIEVSERIVIKPSFKQYDSKPGQIILEIDPKMSFGTGEHETTRLSLRMLEKYFVEGSKVLDVGSGTAVLSICAAKLGAERVIAVDNNEWSYENGVENVKRNGVEGKVKVLLGEISDVQESEFDLVLANINKNVLKEIKNALIRKIKNGGKLIISGILRADAEEMKAEYTGEHLNFLEIIFENDWVAMTFGKEK